MSIATDAQLIAATRKLPIFALNTAAFGFELACEIAEGSQHANTADDVVNLDHADAVIVLGTIFAAVLIANGITLQGRVVLVAQANDPDTWNIAKDLDPTAVITFRANSEIDPASDIADRIRPNL